jgi:hypothetical protein
VRKIQGGTKTKLDQIENECREKKKKIKKKMENWHRISD